jgi:hypothetical protein
VQDVGGAEVVVTSRGMTLPVITELKVRRERTEHDKEAIRILNSDSKI